MESNDGVPVLIGFSQLFAAYAAGRTESAFRLALWRGVRAGSFPAPLEIGAHRRAWRLRDVEAWAAGLRPVSYAPAPESRPAA